MAAINFPDSPSVDDTHTVGSITWKWDGATWKSLGMPVSTGPTGAAGADGVDGETSFSSFLLMGA